MANSSKSGIQNDTWQVAIAMFSALVFGIVVVGYCLHDNGTIWRGLMWAGAWSAAGWLLGFIFGIPRFLSTDTARKPAAAALEKLRQKVATTATAKVDTPNADPAQAAADVPGETGDTERARQEMLDATQAASGQSLTVNTNLEQISDWLTKIIVGVSLVEWQSLCNNLNHMAALMAVSLVGTDPTGALQFTTASTTAAPVLAAGAASAASAAAGRGDATVISCVSSACWAMDSFALALLLYFLIIGILGSYLLTRLFLQKALAEAAP